MREESSRSYASLLCKIQLYRRVFGFRAFRSKSFIANRKQASFLIFACSRHEEKLRRKSKSDKENKFSVFSFRFQILDIVKSQP